MIINNNIDKKNRQVVPVYKEMMREKTLFNAKRAIFMPVNVVY